MATRRQAKADLFDVVPSEIILRILDFMWPYDYSGFTCTCREALELVNAKWVSDDGGCSQYRDSTVSLTGAWLRSLRECRKEYEADVSNTGFSSVDDDPDL